MSLCGRSSVAFCRQFRWDVSAASRRGKATLVASTAAYSPVRRIGRSSGATAFLRMGMECVRCTQRQCRSTTAVREVSLLAADVDGWRDHRSLQRSSRACPRRLGPRGCSALLPSKRSSSTIHSTGVSNGEIRTSDHGRADENIVLDNVLATWPSALSPDATDNTGTSFEEIAKQAAGWLRIHDVVDPEPSASELLAKATGFRSPQEMLARQRQHPTEEKESAKLSRGELEEFRRLCVLRAVQHVPVQYLVGEWDFYGLSLEMQPPSLIPRPETEELVEIVLKWLHQEVISIATENSPAASTAVNANHGGGGVGLSGLRFLDVGSGTGAIGLALLNELPAGTRCVAIDAQETAVLLSRRNAERTGLQGKYICSHIGIAEFGAESRPPTDKGGVETQSASDPSRRTSGTGIEKGGGEEGETLDSDGDFDFIVSNPPYIPRRDMEALPRDVADHEDSIALDGGEDGLDVIRDIVRRCPILLRKGGPRQLWMEVDTSHPEAMQRWLGLEVGVGEGAGADQECESHGVTRFEWMRDMSQRPRFVRLTFAEEDAEMA